MTLTPRYRTLGKPNPEALAVSIRAVATSDTLRTERDHARAERDALAIQVLTLTAERDEARALGRLA